VCGIAGLIAPDGLDAADGWPQRVIRRLEHRGPDDYGWLVLAGDAVRLGRDAACHVDGQAFLMNRRLAILDLSEAGWQPMTAANGRYAIVYNGEIYNFVELRCELEALGHTFRSGSDTEVLLAAYIEWGPRALTRLVGMFAFAILDTHKRTVFLARDFFGIKPLYYATPGNAFAFASEIKALLDLPGVSRRVDPQRLYHYLRFSIVDHRDGTLFADVRQLPAAHYMEIPLDNPRCARPVRYWRLTSGQRRDLSFKQAAARFRDLFLENIRLHLRSDVPVGVALSGGIDSSAVIMAMRQIQGPSLELHSFSYIAEERSSVNEECWVDLVAGAARSVVHKVRATPGDMLAELDDLIETQEEPFANTAIYAQYRVFRLAHEAGIKVMLSGQGADEILAGYRPYLAARLASHVRHGQWVQGARFLHRASRLDDVPVRQLLMEAGGLLLPANAQSGFRTLVGRDLLPPWLNAEWFLERGVEVAPFRRRGGRRVLKEYLHQTFGETSLPQLLRYEDRDSMIYSIESRVPFLTPSLVDFAFSLPEEYIITPDGTSKAVFREAMRGIVPEPVLQRRDKIGFSPGEGAWVLSLGDPIDRAITSTAATIPVFNTAAMQAEWQGVLRSGKLHNVPAWRWFNLTRWAERFDVSFD